MDNALERARRLDHTCEEFFAQSREPFAVKNLENVQGDERDVIFISVGYGRDEHGRISKNFGALNRQGGERRLNVLCTRARNRCVVFSNIRAADLAVDGSPEGVIAFKQFLHFAELGEFDVVETGSGDAESEFEEEVRTALEKKGFAVDAQVGSAGYRIDLAIRDFQNPGRYLLGIECDGARYHSAKSARDRDRLREEVLRRLGWRIHRIWSTAWFHDPETEIDRAAAAIDEAKGAKESAQNIVVEDSNGQLERQPSVRSDDGAEHCSEPYQAASLGLRLPGCELHDVPTDTLADWLESVVKVEGPVHFDVATRRIALALNIQRRGSRIVDAFRTALQVGKRHGRFSVEGQFLVLPDRPQPCVRDRSDVDSFDKKIDHIPPSEIDVAIRDIVLASRGIEAENIPHLVARRLGLGRAGKDVRGAVETRVKKLLRRGNLITSGGFLEWNSDENR